MSTPQPQTEKVSSNFWDDPDFCDRLIRVLARDPQALKKCSHVLKADDFKALRGMPNAWERWVTADRVLAYYEKHHEPVGLLLRAEVLAYARSMAVGERRIGDLDKYLAYLKKIPISAPDAVVEKIVEYKQERIRAATIQEMVELQAAGQMTQEAWQGLVKKVQFNGSNGHTPIDFYKTYRDRAEYRTLQKNNPQNHAPQFFIGPLDDIVRGIGPGSLGLVLAPRKRGKSLFLAWMALAFSFQRLNVLHVTLEDPKVELEKRLDAALTAVPIEKLADSPNYFKHRFGSYTSKHDLRSRLRILDAVGHPTNVAQLEKWVLESRDKGFPVDALIVDYDAYLRIPRASKEQKQYEGIEEMYRDLVTLAGKHKLILWTAAQSTRGTEHLKILGENHVASGVVKLNYAHIVLSIGKGEWSDDSFFIWCGYHKFDSKGVGCNIEPDLERTLFYDATKTQRSQQQYGGSISSKQGEEEDL